MSLRFIWKPKQLCSRFSLVESHSLGSWCVGVPSHRTIAASVEAFLVYGN